MHGLELIHVYMESWASMIDDFRSDCPAVTLKSHRAKLFMAFIPEYLNVKYTTVPSGGINADPNNSEYNRSRFGG